MFGLVVAGRLVQTDIQQVDDNRFLFSIPQADSANHIVLFLTGAVPFPDGYAATVHFQWADRPDWKLLGMLSNDKPSAIFRLKGVVSGSPGQAGATASIGILCEPLAAVQAQVASLASASNASSSTSLVPVNAGAARATPQESLVIAMKCAKIFLNYLSSFVQSAPAGSSIQSILADPSAQSALMGLCERWYKGLESKSKNGVDWLNKEQD